MANWVSAGCGVIANELAQAMEKRGKKLYGVVNRTQEIDIYYKGIGALEVSKVTSSRQE